MKNIIKIIICLVFMIAFTGFANAQVKSVTGNYCGEEEAGDGAYYYFLVNVKNSVMEFSMMDSSKIKILNSKIKYLNQIPVGSELIVKYVVKRKEKVLRSVKLTGKFNKNTKSCSP